MKLPLIRIDLCLKLVFENANAGRNTGCELRESGNENNADNAKDKLLS
jgi:hypothetical protein